MTKKKEAVVKAEFPAGHPSSGKNLDGSDHKKPEKPGKE